MRVLEPFACRAQHLFGRNPQAVEGQRRVAAGHRAVDRIGNVFDADGGVRQLDQEHAGAATVIDPLGLGHDDADLGAKAAGDEGFAPLDDPMVAGIVSRFPAGGLHHRRIGAGAAPVGRFGHEKGPIAQRLPPEA